MEKSLNKPLRECTIFDLTRDQKQLESATGFEGITYDEYMDMVGERAIIIHMMTFAEETEDTELLQALEKEFKDELARFFNE